MHNADLIRRLFPKHGKAIVVALTIVAWLSIGGVLVWQLLR